MKHNSNKSLQREITLEEVKTILSKTIVCDDASKVITFLGALLTYTSEDQVSIAFKAESATGKTYIVQQVLEFYPQEDISFIAYSSPTAFYHEEGKLYDKDGVRIDPPQEPKADDPPALRKAWRKRLRTAIKVVNWEKKIVVFLDQPHDDLLKRLRPLLSHDRKHLVYKVTDKTGQYGLKTKTMIVKGYPTVYFCSSKTNMDDQERTRLFLLSPESTQPKIEASLRLATKRLSNRDVFEESLETDHDRKMLIQRILAIKGENIREIIIPNADLVCEKFLKQHKTLSPRAQRDFPRLLALIKAHALLNCFSREHGPDSTILANQKDIDAGFLWYNKIMQSNELGLSPETYDLFLKIFDGKEEGLTKDAILKEYFKVYGRTLNARRLERDILPALKSTGVIVEETSWEDRRVKIYIPLKGGVKTSQGLDMQQYPEEKVK